jgi:hypothetical protein
MKITTALLEEKGACVDAIIKFEELWPEVCRSEGVEPAVVNLMRASQEHLDLGFCTRFLPFEGAFSQREIAWWCAGQVKQYLPKRVLKEIAACFEIIPRKIKSPEHITTGQLAYFERIFEECAGYSGLSAMGGHALSVVEHASRPYTFERANYAWQAVSDAHIAFCMGDSLEDKERFNKSFCEKLSEFLLHW